MAAFAAEVGPEGPVAVLGGGTRGDLGGPVDPGARVVRAPSGVWDVRPRELVAVVGAGTPLAELDAHLAPHGQRCALEGPAGSTVGGAVSSGRGGIDQRGLGPVRDVVLGARAVNASGSVVVAGGATVKNVSGYDLCRLWTGSLGTLALLGEVTLRTQPLPTHEEWRCGPADPGEVDRCVPDALAVLWDGSSVWVHLAGHPGDVAEARADLAALGCADTVAGPPALPPHRRSLGPGELPGPLGHPAEAGRAHAGDDRHRGLPAGWLLEVGVGILHTPGPPPARPIDRRLWELHRSVKERFDPRGRLNPGRSPLHGAVPG